jgi:hypothetical protein
MAKKKRKRGGGRTAGRPARPGQGGGAKPTRAEKEAAQRAARERQQAEQAEQAERAERAQRAAQEAAGPDRGGLVAWAAFGLIAAGYLVLKSYSCHWQIGDENVYLYMAWAGLDHGALPYRDFFFAHPPLHLLPGWPVFGLLGIGPASARVIPVGATLVSAGMLFLIARRWAGRLAAVATVFVFLSAYSLIRASSHWTGINLTVMWICVGLFFLLRRRPATAGVMLALAVCTGNYALPAAVMALALAALERWRAGLRYLVGFAVPWAVIQLAGLLLGGGRYLDGVYRFHFLKSSKPGVSRQMFYRVATDNWLLHIGAVLGPLLAWADRWLGRASGRALPEREHPEQRAEWGGLRFWLWWRGVLWLDGARGLARIGALWALGYLLFIAVIPRVFPFYFLLLFPGLALAAGVGVERLIRHGGGLLRRWVRREAAWRRAAVLWTALVLVLVSSFWWRVPLQRALLPRYVRTRPVPMQWNDSPLPVNGLLRACCFDDVAQPRTAYGTVQEVLYHESRYFEQAPALAAWLSRHGVAGKALFGDSSSAGLVALLSGRRLIDDFADTNTLRFVSGISPPDEVIRRIDRPELGYVIVSARPQRGRHGVHWRYRKFASIPTFRRWLERDFRRVHRVHDRTKGTFLILERRGLRPQPD